MDTRASTSAVRPHPILRPCASRGVRGRSALLLAALPAALCSALASAAAGQDEYFRSPLIDVGAEPESAVSGDLDADGDRDLLVATKTDILVVLLQSAEGEFELHTAYPTGLGLKRMALADLDGDGRLDLAHALDGPDSEALAVRLGDGAGGFGEAVTYATATGPSDVDLADLDGDGDLDAVLPCVVGQRLSVLLNQGDGSFGPRTDFGAGPLPLSTALGDWNGDGAPDAAVANSGTTAGQMAVTLLLNDRAGGFVAGGSIPMAAPVVDIETGRFDAGEAADLAVSTKTLAQVFVLFGQGDGGFAAPLALPSPLSPQQLAVGDLDEDGDDDIACTSNAGTNDAVGVILSRGDGSFEPPARYGALGTTVELLIDDLTGDGDADLAACTTEFLFGRWLMLLEGRGDGSFGPYSGIAGNNCPDVAFGQLDGDGRLDMVAGANLDDQLSIVPGTGDGFFGRAQGLSMDDGHASGRPQLVAVADLDGDGLQDLAVGMGNTLEPRIDILLGDGALGLLPPIVLPIAAAGTDLAALDLDQDGDADLLATLTNASLLVRLNDGRGGFATSDSYQTLPSPVALATGLLDADALLDVVVATSGGTGSGVVHVYLGAGGGALQEPLSFETGVVQTGLAVADLDQDGDDDVAVSASSNALVWLENDGAGFLSAGGSLPTVSTNPAGVAAADVDADGIMDLVGACTSTSPYSGHGSLAWLRGAGGGLFEPALLVDAPMGMEGLVAQDLDGDGRPDFAAPCLDDIVATVLNRSGPWNDLDHALAGGLGLPKLVGEGPLVAGTPFRITLTDSRPSSLVSLFLGLSPLDAPFKGGVLVPAPLLKLILATDAAGDLELAGNWPPGPSGLELLMQYWFADPAGPVGFAASNALSATIP